MGDCPFICESVNPLPQDFAWNSASHMSGKKRRALRTIAAFAGRAYTGARSLNRSRVTSLPFPQFRVTEDRRPSTSCKHPKLMRFSAGVARHLSLTRRQRAFVQRIIQLIPNRSCTLPKRRQRKSPSTLSTQDSSHVGKRGAKTPSALCC